MKVKCKICGLKGYFEESKVTEFWASRFLHIHISKNKKDFLSFTNSHFICRKCVSAIFDALKFESNRIDDLYKPEIKEKCKEDN